MLRDYPLHRHRNIGIIAHIDAGKTTCSERILFYTGKIHRTGEVHHGDTELDFSPEERRMGITISAAATTVTWAPTAGLWAGVRHEIQLVDTPGHVDFTIEVERSLRVLDGAVALFDAGHGVEPQSETVWRQADRYELSRIAFINKMDKVGASFTGSVDSIRQRLGVVPLPVQLPIGEEGGFRGVLDLVRERAIVFEPSADTPYAVVEVPPELRADAGVARARLVEACAELDDALLEIFVEAGPAVEASDLEAALRRITLSRRGVVVLCGSSLKNKGIQMLLDAVVTYLPSPVDVPPVRGSDPRTGVERLAAADDGAPLVALAFKSATIDRLGSVTFVRVYSGVLCSGATVLDASSGKRERIGRLVSMHGARATDIEAAPAGTIAAVVGLRHVRTGDTITDPRAPLVLAGMTVPEPVVELVVEPRTVADQERLSSGLGKLAAEDPSFRISTDEESGRTLLRGMGELHLAILVERLRREHGVAVLTGRPSVAYRETLGRRARAEHRLVKQSGGPGQYAHVVLEVEPLPLGGGFVFEDHTRGGVVPKELLPAIEQGIRGAMSRGVVAGHPIVDVAVRLVDGSTHVNDSKAPAFEVAASIAFRAAAEAAQPYLLEPIMAVEVVTPEEYLGEVLGDLNGRRGEVRQLSARGNARVVEALVPLRSLFGHVGDLRSRTQGRASASMVLARYARVPETAARAVIEERTRAA